MWNTLKHTFTYIIETPSHFYERYKVNHQNQSLLKQKLDLEKNQTHLIVDLPKEQPLEQNTNQRELPLRAQPNLTISHQESVPLLERDPVYLKHFKYLSHFEHYLEIKESAFLWIENTPELNYHEFILEFYSQSVQDMRRRLNHLESYQEVYEPS